MMGDKLKLIPLGGVGEIGSNATLIELEDKYVLLDYGILFPYDDFFDINYLIVDLDDIKFDKELILFITHGHEDHIGAISHFVQRFPKVQIYAPNFAFELIKVKLSAANLPINVKIYDESDKIEFEQYDLIPLHVTHSIPDTYGVIFKHKEKSKSLLFISDFKFDLNPSFEKPFDTKTLEKYFTSCEERIALLDSTNILVDGKTLSESDLTESFDELFQRKQRIFVTQFSSNIFRMKNIMEAAKQNNKKITTIGRSIQRYLEAASEAKLINLDDYPIVDFDSVQNYDSKDLVLIVTGSQGEYLGALKRIASGEQKNINIKPEDLFVFSSKPIPGNEKKIYRIYNMISEYDAKIITFKEKKVHASGHPGREDLKQLIDIAKPTAYVPIHGETYFLRKHIEFINSSFPQINTYYLENFEGLDFSKDPYKSFIFESKDPKIIHGKGIEIERDRISQRRKLACNGSVFISIGIKKQNIDVTTMGLPVNMDEQSAKLKEYVTYLAFSEYKNRDHDYTCEEIRIKVRKFYNELLGYKPIVTIHLL